MDANMASGIAEPLDRIMASPGLHFIFVDILLSLGLEDFRKAIEEVCQKWKLFACETELWYLKLKQLAPRGSYYRRLLEERSEAFQRIINSEDANEVTQVELSSICKDLCFKLHNQTLLQNWKQKSFKVCYVENAQEVRGLNVLEHDLAYIHGPSILISPKDFQFQRDTQTVKISVKAEMKGHRRDVSCLDYKDGVILAGGRDRKLTLWRVETQKLLTEVREAHARLITCVKIVSKHMALSASRDQSVKAWKMDWNADGSGKLTLLQTMDNHFHSVWCIDMNNSFLISGCGDRSLWVWTNNNTMDGITPPFQDFHQCQGHKAGVREALIFKGHDHLAISGDLWGHLLVWDLNEKKACYEVEELEDQAWFRFSGGVASMSECSEASYFCAAFGNHCIALYSTLNVQDSLPILRVINLEGLVNPGLLRSVVARATQLYIALFSGSDGIVVLDTW